jgi:hypothetical protein
LPSAPKPRRTTCPRVGPCGRCWLSLILSPPGWVLHPLTARRRLRGTLCSPGVVNPPRTLGVGSPSGNDRAGASIGSQAQGRADKAVLGGSNSTPDCHHGPPATSAPRVPSTQPLRRLSERAFRPPVIPGVSSYGLRVLARVPGDPPLDVARSSDCRVRSGILAVGLACPSAIFVLLSTEKVAPASFQELHPLKLRTTSCRYLDRRIALPAEGDTVRLLQICAGTSENQTAELAASREHSAILQSARGDPAPRHLERVRAGEELQYARKK